MLFRNEIVKYALPRALALAILLKSGRQKSSAYVNFPLQFDV